MKQKIDIQSLRGFKDKWGIEADCQEYITNIISQISFNYNISRIYLPILERTELFSKNIGKLSDIVSKEMYTFNDRKNRSVSLRPEGTVGTIRLLLENKLYKENKILKFYYVGPMFRYERPQNNRYRQFYQYGVEYINVLNNFQVIELIQLGYTITVALNIKDIEVSINTLGTEEEIIQYSKVLYDYFKKYEKLLCDKCKIRLNKNILRILDCKLCAILDIAKNIPDNTKCLSKKSLNDLNFIFNKLKNSNIDSVINKKLVRGIDYYRNIVFEFIDKTSGDAIFAGGMYNSISTKIGLKKEISCCGFAIGIERLCSLFLFYNPKSPINNFVRIMILSEEDKMQDYINMTSFMLRHSDYSIESDYNICNNIEKYSEKLKKQNYNFIIIINEINVKAKTVNIINLNDNSKSEIKIDSILEYFDNTINNKTPDEHK